MSDKISYNSDFVGDLPWKCPKCGGPVWQDGEIYCQNYRTLQEVMEDREEELKTHRAALEPGETLEGDEVTEYDDEIALRKVQGPEEACDFEATPCPNDGTCVVVVDLGWGSAHFVGKPFCGYCDAEYKDEDYDSAILNKVWDAFSGKASVFYHQTWWEEAGLTLELTTSMEGEISQTLADIEKASPTQT